MSSQGPLLAGTGATFASGDVDWSNPTRITASDASNATVSLVGAELSYHLVGSNFGFTLAGGSGVLGIEVIWRRNQDSAGAGDITDNLAHLWNGGLIGDNKSIGASWFLDPGYEDKSFGGASDTWGLGLTDTEVNASVFGTTLRCLTNGAQTARVDSVTMTITYDSSGSVYRQIRRQHVRRLTEYKDLDTY